MDNIRKAIQTIIFVAGILEEVGYQECEIGSRTMALIEKYKIPVSAEDINRLNDSVVQLHHLLRRVKGITEDYNKGIDK